MSVSSGSAPEYSPVSEAGRFSTSSSPEEDFDIGDFDEVALAKEQQCGGYSGSDWNGFKIVGDNIDKNVRPSFQRPQYQTKSLHHFHSYAVRDRVDFSSLSDVDRSLASVDAQLLLVTDEEWSAFKDSCGILISRYVFDCYNYYTYSPQ